MGAYKFSFCGSPWLAHSVVLGMSLEMTFDELKGKNLKDQPDQKRNGEKAKGTRGR